MRDDLACQKDTNVTPANTWKCFKNITDKKFLPLWNLLSSTKNRRQWNGEAHFSLYTKYQCLVASNKSILKWSEVKKIGWKVVPVPPKTPKQYVFTQKKRDTFAFSRIDNKSEIRINNKNRKCHKAQFFTFLFMCFSFFVWQVRSKLRALCRWRSLFSCKFFNALAFSSSALATCFWAKSLTQEGSIVEQAEFAKVWLF